MAIYMKYGNIEGDATQQGYEGWINLNSFSWSLDRKLAPNQVGRSANRESGQAEMGKCTVTKEADACSGDILRTATTEFQGQDCSIVFLRTGNPGEPYLQFTLRDALIANLSVATSSERPTETITIDFIKVEIECKTIDETNSREDNMIVTYDSTTGIGS